MSKTPVTINVPSAEKDVVDAIVIAYKDIKANEPGKIVSDEIQEIIKIVPEIGELVSELKTRDSFSALAYLIDQIASA